MHRSEFEEQKQLFKVIEDLKPIWPKFALIFHIPNGGSGPLRGMAGKMKAIGMKAGVSDIFYPVARQGYHGFWIEMKSKRPGAKITKDQTHWLIQMRWEGYNSIVCHGYLEALRALIEYETGKIFDYDLITKLPVMWQISRKQVLTMLNA